MARVHGISRCTTSLIRKTRPITGKKMATHGELHHRHNHGEETLGGTTAGTSRQYDESTNDEFRL